MIVNVAVVGSWQAGKTTAVRSLAQALQAQGYAVEGLVQPALRSGEHVDGYDLIDVASGERRRLARRRRVKLPGQLGFVFDEEAWTWAAERIRAARRAGQVVVVDELGRVEADTGGGHLLALLEPMADETVRVRLLGVREDREEALAARMAGFQRRVAVPVSDAARAELLAWVGGQLGGQP